MIDRLFIAAGFMVIGATAAMIYIASDIKTSCRDNGAFWIDQKEYKCTPPEPPKKRPVNYTT